MYNVLTTHAHNHENFYELFMWPCHLINLIDFLKFTDKKNYFKFFTQRQIKHSTNYALPIETPLKISDFNEVIIKQLQKFSDLYISVGNKTAIEKIRRSTYKSAHKPPSNLIKNINISCHLHDDDMFNAFFCHRQTASLFLNYSISKCIKNVISKIQIEMPCSSFTMIENNEILLSKEAEDYLYDLSCCYGILIIKREISTLNCAILLKLWLGNLGLFSSKGHITADKINKYVMLQFNTDSCQIVIHKIKHQNFPYDIDQTHLIV